MRGMYPHHFSHGFRGWHRGGMFFPLFLPLLVGGFVLFLLIQSGLWLPLLLIGIVFWMFSPMRRRWWRGGFYPMDGKSKHDFSTRHYYADPTPKHNDGIEYV